ncbi:MAG: hypothetical protein IT461_04365 [Planctomycetes bacterium]|nr:hypothetical protein [Planctomycetota bacterium]
MEYSERGLSAFKQVLILAAAASVLVGWSIVGISYYFTPNTNTDVEDAQAFARELDNPAVRSAVLRRVRDRFDQEHRPDVATILLNSSLSEYDPIEFVALACFFSDRGSDAALGILKACKMNVLSPSGASTKTNISDWLMSMGVRIGQYEHYWHANHQKCKWTGTQHSVSFSMEGH